MKRAVMTVLTVAALCGAEEGMRPRSAASDYPVQGAASDAAIGALVLSPTTVKTAFATDLNRGYVVVEVGVFPKGGSVNVSPQDFALRIGTDQVTVRPVGPRAVAGALQGKQAAATGSPSDITVYPTVGVGYGTGPRGYDPVTGNRGGGWNTNVGVGVATGGGPSGPPPAGATDQDRRTMQTELEEKQLPEQQASKPVAGYLYFPVPVAKRKSVAYELEFYPAQGGKVRLPLPAAR